jgi:glucose-1-phosphate cytidylyltransferase
MMKIQTIILCGGLGTRLREETDFRPKPMVPIGGKPILWHIMKIFSQFGFTDFILPLGYKGNLIKEYFYHYYLMSQNITIQLGDHHAVSYLPSDSYDPENWSITLVDTGENTLKGSRLKRVEKYISGDEVMVTYGDGLADINLGKLLAFHRSHGKMATVTGISPASQFGELHINGNRVEHFREKPSSSVHFVSCGFFVFNRAFFNYLTPDVLCDLEVGPLEDLATQGELMVYKHPGRWACMDTIRDMEYLNRLWDNNEAFWKTW